MVAMPGDSYLLKAPAPPCQGQPCRRGAPRSTSCGVTTALVLLMAGVLALAGVVYYVRLELCSLRGEVQSLASKEKTREAETRTQIDFLDARMGDMDRKLMRINMVQQMKTFENAGMQPLRPDVEADQDVDDTQPVYDDLEGDFPMENRAQGQVSERPGGVPRLEPAGSLSGATQAQPTHSSGPVASTTIDPESELDLYDGYYEMSGFRTRPGRDGRRKRREVTANNRRGDPQLKLYHMLQAPGLATAAPPPLADIWSHAQPMYAEHAPTDYVTPPRRVVDTPVVSRRSRVMDGLEAQTEVQHRRHPHRSRTGRMQRMQQQGLQAVDTTRSVEVGLAGRRHGHYDDPRPWRGPRRGAAPPASWGDRGLKEPWRGARTARVTDHDHTHPRQLP